MKPVPALLARQFAEQDQVTHERTASAGPWPGDSRMSSAVIIPRVSVPLLAALVLDCGSDVLYAHLERQRVLLVHAAELVHERGHVPQGVVRKALHAHELPAAGRQEPSPRRAGTPRDAVAVGVDGGVVNGNVSRPPAGGDEPVTCVRAEPLHCALSHLCSPALAVIGMRGRAPGCGDRRRLKLGPGPDGACGQNFAGAMTRTRTSTTTSFI